MDKRVEQLWLDALRSGEYTQGIGCLRTPDDKYCCLGVLSDLYLKENSGKWDCKVNDNPVLNTAYNLITSGGKNYILPTDDVYEWAGLSKNITLPYNGQNILITDLNDRGRLSFAAIADLIEAEYPLQCSL